MVAKLKIGKEYKEMYFDSIGKRAYTTRIQSDMGQMEMESIRKAHSLGHVPRVHIDNKISSFLTCMTCDMMGSVTSDEGTSGSILEVKCGTSISISDPERAWDQAEDPFKYQVESFLLDEDLPNG
jgi:hypothetical protein